MVMVNGWVEDQCLEVTLSRAIENIVVAYGKPARRPMTLGLNYGPYVRLIKARTAVISEDLSITTAGRDRCAVADKYTIVSYRWAIKTLVFFNPSAAVRVWRHRGKIIGRWRAGGERGEVPAGALVRRQLDVGGRRVWG
ncbi:unnamed protein product, partial [Iphiclides podalirius]